MADEVLEISLTRSERKVKINGEEWTVKEMMGTQRDQWMNSMAGRMKTDAAGKTTGVKDFTGLHSSLICLCLHSPDGKLALPAVVAQWPASAQTKLFELCQEVNGLGDDKNVDEVKND